MLYHIALVLKPSLSFFNMIHSVSFRAIAALLTTLGMSIMTGDWCIETAKRFFSAESRPHTPDTHKAKGAMPTMGGLWIIACVVLNVLFWCNLTDLKVWLFIALIVSFGGIGCWDDWQKICHGKGISACLKFALQCLFAGVIVSLLLCYGLVTPVLCLPFFKQASLWIGRAFIVWATFIIVGCSNGVNLTDGLDGLAIGVLIPNFGLFGIICYLAGHKQLAAYLYIAYAQCQEMTVVCAILMGASLGFLWFNTYPAQIFMGDVGSLALGSALAYVALVSKQEFLLPIAGGLFVLETLSVMVQVISVKLFGKRVFRMAPIHHHFELMGWAESRITVRFWIISLVLCLVALIVFCNQLVLC